MDVSSQKMGWVGLRSIDGLKFNLHSTVLTAGQPDPKWIIAFNAVLTV